MTIIRPDNAEAFTCPVCGQGTLADVAYDAAQDPEQDLEQQPDSRQLDVYTCGHEVPGAPLRAADERLDVERRDAAETAEPLPDADA
jgi:hypothetical protein